MRAIRILLCPLLFAVLPFPLEAQNEMRGVEPLHRHGEPVFDSLLIARDSVLLDTSPASEPSQQVSVETKEVAEETLKRFLYNVAVGVTVVVLSTLILRVIL